MSQAHLPPHWDVSRFGALGRREWDETPRVVGDHVLRQRAERGEPGLTNREVRQITHLDRH